MLQFSAWRSPSGTQPEQEDTGKLQFDTLIDVEDWIRGGIPWVSKWMNISLIEYSQIKILESIFE